MYTQLTNLQAHTVEQLAVVVIVIVVVYTMKRKKGELTPFSYSAGFKSSTSSGAPVATEIFQ